MVNSYCSQQLLASIPSSPKRYAALATAAPTGRRIKANPSAAIRHVSSD
jgi:hypothetical protein